MHASPGPPLLKILHHKPPIVAQIPVPKQLLQHPAAVHSSNQPRDCLTASVHSTSCSICRRLKGASYHINPDYLINQAQEPQRVQRVLRLTAKIQFYMRALVQQCLRGSSLAVLSQSRRSVRPRSSCWGIMVRVPRMTETCCFSSRPLVCSPEPTFPLTASDGPLRYERKLRDLLLKIKWMDKRCCTNFRSHTFRVRFSDLNGPRGWRARG